jgi:hypothetical protein
MTDSRLSRGHGRRAGAIYPVIEQYEKVLKKAERQSV